MHTYYTDVNDYELHCANIKSLSLYLTFYENTESQRQRTKVGLDSSITNCLLLFEKTNI